jgi:hypothetical protein
MRFVGALTLPCLLLLLQPSVRADAQGWSTWRTSAVVEDRGYPVFTVSGRPFFVYGAAFFYERIPRDRWAASLEAYRRVGINTIDLYVMWNWHELSDGRFDFTGRTNDRRDLHALLALVHRMGFKIILRPGPVIRNEWRNGGYPAWLLQRSEYNMPLHDVLEGRYPATATLQNAHADAAADEWLHNATHVRYARRWLRKVLTEVEARSHDVIAIALDDDQGAYIDNDTWPAPRWHAYIGWLKATVRGVVGTRVPLFINTYQMKVTASAPVWAWGNWYQSDAYSIGDHDLSQLAFSTSLLQTQPGLPVMASEFQAGWLQAADEVVPRPADPTNTTLALHELLQRGARGIVNFPVQDTLNPAGWEAPWANWFYAWDAALTLQLAQSARYDATARFGRLVSQLGAYLATLHSKSDLTIAWLPSAYDPASLGNDRVAAIAAATITALQRCRSLALTCGLVDLRFASDADLRNVERIVLPPAAFTELAFTSDTQERIASLRARGIMMFSSVDTAARGLHPANGGIRDATLLLAPDGRSGILDVFNAGTATRAIPATHVQLGTRSVRIPAFTLAPRSAADLMLGSKPPYVIQIAQSAAPSRGTVTTNRVELSPTQWYDAPALSAVPAGEVTARIADFFRDGEPVVILESHYVRVIVSPAAGARAFVFENLASGSNAFTTIGAFRDDVATPARPSARDFIATYTHPFETGTFNRPYACAVLQTGKRAVARCTYDALDVSPVPVHFAKTFELAADARALSVIMHASANAVTLSGVSDRPLSVTGDCAPTGCSGVSKPGYRLLRFAYPANTDFRLVFSL